MKLLLAAAVLLAGALTPAVAQADDPLEYVALGDSSAAGPLIPHQISLVCLRSGLNYPHQAAERLGAKLTDVSCSGAVVFPEPYGTSGEDRFTAGGTDQLADRIAAAGPSVGRALDAIHAKAPNAKVLVTGYGTYIKPGGCYPLVPAWARDADYLQASVDRLNAMLAEQAAAHGATYVDLRTPSIGHDACARTSTRWLDGLFPGSAAAPLHPSALGMANFGAIVAAAAR